LHVIVVMLHQSSILYVNVQLLIGVIVIYSMGWQVQGQVITDLEGTIEAYYAWELGIISNNTTTVCALWQGLKIEKGIDMQSIKVV
jgi:hypothetical protein